MPSAGFEPTIPVSEQPQTHALDRAATGIGVTLLVYEYNNKSIMSSINNVLIVSDCRSCIADAAGTSHVNYPERRPRVTHLTSYIADTAGTSHVNYPERRPRVTHLTSCIADTAGTSLVNYPERRPRVTHLTSCIADTAGTSLVNYPERRPRVTHLTSYFPGNNRPTV
jgi:NifB/MoaA-like Fe-S oxidoreductase